MDRDRVLLLDGAVVARARELRRVVEVARADRFADRLGVVRVGRELELDALQDRIMQMCSSSGLPADQVMQFNLNFFPVSTPGSDDS